MGMPRARYCVFEPFCLDVLDERLWKSDANIPLGYKAFCVLAYLVGHPQQLVAKNDLLSAVWPDVSVSEAVLTTAMREIRIAIDDTARTPRFIQTVHGRGYRFVADVVETNERAARAAARQRLTTPEQRGIVGRQAEWRLLGEWYAAVQNGTRRIGFIAGEAGMGKTALVDAFVAAVASASDVRICRGQCVDQYGGGEAYMPILEALGRLGRDRGESVVRVLSEHAPSWLAHLPSLAVRSPSTSPVRPERMLRELTEALEVLAAVEPLVLVLEDLHWSDVATLRWLGYVARRRDSTRLLILATYRPVEALLLGNVLRALLADLRHQPQIAEVVLDYLPGDAVNSYLRYRRVASSALDDLASMLHQRTGGHPLFLVSIVDAMIQAGVGERNESRTRRFPDDSPDDSAQCPSVHRTPIRAAVGGRSGDTRGRERCRRPFFGRCRSGRYVAITGADRSPMCGLGARRSHPRCGWHCCVAGRNDRSALSVSSRRVSRVGICEDLA